MDAKTLRRVASDPAAFQAEIVIPSGHGPQRFGDCMADFQRERFASINPSLVAVAKGEMPPIGRHWWEATKGASKDSDLAVCILWLLAFTRRPLNCQIGAADQDQADELRKAAKDILRLNPWLAQRVSVQTWRLTCEATDSTAEIIAADVAGSHGARPDVLILNELSHVTKQEFAENLLDNAAKVPRGLVCIATNSGFTGTWQAKWREIATSSAQWNFHALSKPSPWLKPSDIEEARRRNPPARFMRLWYGVWASGAGDAIDADDIAAAVNPDLRPLTRGDGNLVFSAGLDLGLKNDHAALVVLASDGPTQRIRLASCQSWRPSQFTGQVDLSAVEAAVLSAHQRFDLKSVAFDPWQAALMSQRLTKAGVTMKEMVFQASNLNLMASTLLDCFRSRRIDLYPDSQLLTDLGRLSIVEKSYGCRLASTRDADGHADTATALAIVLPTAVECCLYSGEALIMHHMDSGRGRGQLDGSYMSRPDLFPSSRFIG